MPFSAFNLYELKFFQFALESADITLPKVVRERLIVLSSKKCFVDISSSLLIFSLPARSQRFSFAHFSIPLASTLSVSTKIWNIEWDQEESMLALVDHLIRFHSPLFNKAKQSHVDKTTYSVNPSTYIPLNYSSHMFKGFFVWVSCNKS